MEKLSKFLSKAIVGVVMFTIAILCFVVNSRSKNSSGAFEAISIVMGVTFIVVASLAFLATMLIKRRIATPEGLAAASLLAVGIFFAADKTVGGMILTYIVEYVPYELVVVGSVFIADAILILCLALKNKTNNYMIPVVAECITGGITLLLGILAFTVDGIKNNKFLILGIILIIYSIFVILSSLFEFLIGGGKIITFKSEGKPNSVDAEFTVIDEDKTEEE